MCYATKQQRSRASPNLFRRLMGVSYREYLKTQRKADKKAVQASRSQSLRGKRAETGAAFWAIYGAKPHRGPETKAASRQAAQVRMF